MNKGLSFKGNSGAAQARLISITVVIFFGGCCKLLTLLGLASLLLQIKF